jgi:hypothetical protein
MAMRGMSMEGVSCFLCNRVPRRTLPPNPERPESTLARVVRRAAKQPLANYKKSEDVIGETGLPKQLTKLLVEKVLYAEMTEPLGHDKHKPVAILTGNTRNCRRSRASSASCRSMSRVTGTAASSRS